MRIKDRPTIDHMIRMCRNRGGAVMHIRLKLAMSDLRQFPGTDRYVLAAVYALDGKAVIRPGTLRCGLLVRDWSSVMRYIRKHNCV